MPTAVGDLDSLRQRVESIEWYHTIDLAPDVSTPGWFDTRALPDRVGFPADLGGQRCLDVATFDGFWAFTMEKRSARAVVAIDIPDPRRWDWPADSTPEVISQVSRRRPGEGFALAAEALESKVDRREISVYDLDPQMIGRFDFVYVGSLLLHLRDPVGALMKVRSVCEGTLMLVDAVHTSLPGRGPAATLDGKGRPWWWKPNVAGLVRMVEAAGFILTARPGRVRIPAGSAQEQPTVSPRLLASHAGREALTIARYGDPHAVLIARPN